MRLMKGVISTYLFLLLTHLSQAQTLAFPGAEGFGKFTKGGRGGKVYIVSNLNDSGPGSFREAAEAKHPRIIVFNVSGTIHLNSRLNVSKNATIAGQSAPGDGICIADYPVSLSGDNIIMRYMRIRMGDRYQNKGMIDGAGSDDALSGSRKKNIIVDHCSLSWSTDEVMSIYGGDSTTFQWNLIAEPLNYSYHFEEGDKDFENHGYGGIWGGSALSAHHNLFAHCVSRTPRFNGARLGASDELVDFRNNVIYNWRHNNVYGGEGGFYNIVNNYYKPGPNTSKSVKSRILNPTKPGKNKAYGKFYVAGNFMYGDTQTSKNNILGVHFDKSASPQDKDTVLVNKPFEALSLQDVSAEDAYQSILKYVGASFSRDTLDKRLIEDVIRGKGKIIDVQGGHPHGTSYEMSKTAWPTFKKYTPYTDSDNDGIPDSWEKANGLNPKDASDAVKFDVKGSGYTNIEIYLNSLVNEKSKRK
ncbi:pectate lyase [Pseudopedobacter sp.]|uniref:pectate lyase n=1 Tax=Pseudopedobacter sp. TaxID=1936787 RepID=UPI0033403957